MKILHIAKPLIFVIPSAILIGIGLWLVTFNAENYLKDMNMISNSKGICNGKHCYCTNARCVTADDLSNSYIGYFEWSIGFLVAGGVILLVSRKWWK